MKDNVKWTRKKTSWILSTPYHHIYGWPNFSSRSPLFRFLSKIVHAFLICLVPVTCASHLNNNNITASCFPFQSVTGQRAWKFKTESIDIYHTQIESHVPVLRFYVFLGLTSKSFTQSYLLLSYYNPSHMHDHINWRRINWKTLHPDRLWGPPSLCVQTCSGAHLASVSRPALGPT
jgi:hypothetical protein